MVLAVVNPKLILTQQGAWLRYFGKWLCAFRDKSSIRHAE